MFSKVKTPLEEINRDLRVWPSSKGVARLLYDSDLTREIQGDLFLKVINRQPASLIAAETAPLPASLLLQCCVVTHGVPIIASSRVSSSNETGGFFEGLDVADASLIQIIPHVIDTAELRTNIGINNVSDKSGHCPHSAVRQG
jgi:hypothetical protein